MSQKKIYIQKIIKQVLNENIAGKFVGYHCSDKDDLETNVKDIVFDSPERFEWHQKILKKLRHKYPEVEKYIEMYDPQNYGDVDDDELAAEVAQFLGEKGISGVWVCNDKPARDPRWGKKYCYKVYFEQIEFEGIYDFILADEGHDNCYLYIYQNYRPQFILI